MPATYNDDGPGYGQSEINGARWQKQQSISSGQTSSSAHTIDSKEEEELPWESHKFTLTSTIPNISSLTSELSQLGPIIPTIRKLQTIFSEIPRYEEEGMEVTLVNQLTEARFRSERDEESGITFWRGLISRRARNDRYFSSIPYSIITICAKSRTTCECSIGPGDAPNSIERSTFGNPSEDLL
ncbi:uncharacterized protein I303_100896 [Kwoniella dejecticola CBS 10117]|uniref:Uncharacterized protein n=1 Tax=Kwoniella dejecticola CBS 10117 TaxID=1296121 RepID=A0A1A6AGC2_9TREE|nr:uncharacterized protein I303_00900 [Kwoniella dejecticola CBS 10117]OBR89078.1 hypothetical protein I303_00900 [Kwoniella dejecticola CBS 10117]